MNNKTTRSVLSIALLAGTAAVLPVTNFGCTNQTEGERTMDNADRMKDAGEMIRKGEMEVEDGKALQARGDAIKQQGDNAQGDKLVAEGKAREALGNKHIEEGRNLRDKSK